MINFPIPKIEKGSKIYNTLIAFSRFKEGDIFIDKKSGHRIGCIDCSDKYAVKKLMGKNKAALAVHDPPYNIIVFDIRKTEDFIFWCEKWIDNTENFMSENASLYIWIGADQKKHYSPMTDFIMMMRGKGFNSRSFITMRNQRGYGTQKNWMSVRQELLFYTKGNPVFHVQYTDIPKILKDGYYKEIGGILQNNSQRSKSETIRAGNVWVDIQQVFYRMEENVNGCYAQKPIKSIKRIIKASSNEKDIVLDYFAHSGSTLLASEMLGRICFTADIDPIFCEIALRRLEHYRETGKLGWQNGNPFEKELYELGIKSFEEDV